MSLKYEPSSKPSLCLHRVDQYLLHWHAESAVQIRHRWNEKNARTQPTGEPKKTETELDLECRKGKSVKCGAVRFGSPLRGVVKLGPIFCYGIFFVVREPGAGSVPGQKASLAGFECDGAGSSNLQDGNEGKGLPFLRASA